MRKLFVFLFLCCSLKIFAQSTTENYIKKIEYRSQSTIPSSRTLRTPVSNKDYTASRSIVMKPGFVAKGNVITRIVPNFDNNLENIVYYDGLGKPKQQIAVGQSPNKKDIVQHIAYDPFGRGSKQYLPHEYATGALGSFRTNAEASTKTYYKNKYPEDFVGVSSMNDITSYSENQFELSPLNRISKQSAPGELFKIGSGHELKFEYLVNTTNEVRVYIVNANGSLGGGTDYYTSGALIKNVVKNQNWNFTDDKNYTTEEFKDKSGKVILKRYNNNNATHDTYFVYDYLDNLKYVLPPKSEPQLAKPDANELSELCYQYKYDEWNRVVEKKLPGKPWEYIVYDDHDRPILTQDGALRGKTLWAFSKYDTYGRIIYTGLYSSVKSRKSLQKEVMDYINAFNKNNSEDRSRTSKVIGGIAINYENKSFPISSIKEVLAVNYYDDYSFTDINKPSIPSVILDQKITTRTNGLLTASWLKTLGKNTWTKIYTFYDEKGREIRIQTHNHLGGSTVEDIKIDFNGDALKTIATHKKTKFDTAITIVDEFEYDHAQRFKKQTQQINNGAKETIALNMYDGTGMLIQKKVGGKNAALQTIDYKYNVKGALKAINDVSSNLATSPDKDVFAYKLNYESKVEGTAVVPQLFDGNVTQSIWRNIITNDKQSYTYSYDKLSRLSNANYTQGVLLNTKAGTLGLSGVTYDKAGNIETLKRTGTSGLIDNLSYKYKNVGVSTNKLANVKDSSSSAEGYKDTNTPGDNYIYDSNGRLIADKNKGVTNIEYNYIDLPIKITFSNGNRIEITYNAAGKKLEKLYVTSQGSTKTLYIKGFQYQNNQLQFFMHPEGYIYKDGNDFKYSYVYSDYLGNNRLSYSDVDGNGNITSSEVFSKTDYYPLGLPHKGEYIANVGSRYNYKYQGKELQLENNLQQYDFGSRMYDGSVGRWFTIDPQAEKFYGSSPYSAMGNNPVMIVDPDGELAWFVPIIIGAAMGGYTGALQAAGSGGDWFDGFWKGALVGAVGGGLSQIGGGTFFENLIWGVGEGAVTGSLNSILHGKDIGEGLLNGAIMGGAFAAATSTVEMSVNAFDGHGFRTNKGVVNKYVKTGKINDAMNFVQAKYGLDGPKYFYDPELEEMGVTNADGTIGIGIDAFESSNSLKSTMAHEYGHYLRDLGTYNGIRGLKLNNPKEWNYYDGVSGYSEAIRRSGKMHISSRYLRKTVKLSEDSLFIWDYPGGFFHQEWPINPVWHYKGALKNKWFHTLPRRF